MDHIIFYLFDVYSFLYSQLVPSSLETGKLRPLMVWRRQPGGTLWESMESDGAGLLRRHTGILVTP